MTGKIILVTGVSDVIGRLTANALGQSGHSVYAIVREANGDEATLARDVRAYAEEQGVDLRTIAMDLRSEASVNAGISRIVARHGRIDVIVHNANLSALGPAEAFTPGQFAELFDIGVASSQRVNRAALPQMREQRQGLLVWVSSSDVAGGTTPYIAPCLAAMAGMDALAVQYARELCGWGIETTIVVPGPVTPGADRFAHAALPADEARLNAYEAGPCEGFALRVRDAFDRMVPDHADPGQVAGVVAWVVDTPFGERPFRVHVDPGDVGASVAFAVIDRVRDEMLSRLGFYTVIRPRREGS